MHHIFIDTDIILDFLGDRKPFAKFAVEIFIKADKKEIILYTSNNSITTSYYLLCKLTDEKKARSLLFGIMEYINIIPVTDKILKLAIKSDFKDFEDAVQHYCALTIDNIEFIITRNLNDYKKSQIPVIGPEQLSKKT